MGFFQHFGFSPFCAFRERVLISQIEDDSEKNGCNSIVAHVRQENVKQLLTWRVIPSCTNISSVSNHVPVALFVIFPLWASTAYKGALPFRSSHICANVTQPPRASPSADTTYNRAVADEYRIKTGMLASHSGLGIDSFGDSVSCAAAILRASMLRSTAFPRLFVMSVRCVVRTRWCPLRCWT